MRGADREAAGVAARDAPQRAARSPELPAAHVVEAAALPGSASERLLPHARSAGPPRWSDDGAVRRARHDPAPARDSSAPQGAAASATRESGSLHAGHPRLRAWLHVVWDARALGGRKPVAPRLGVHGVVATGAVAAARRARVRAAFRSRPQSGSRELAAVSAAGAGGRRARAEG